MVRDLAVLESLNQQVLDALPSGILFCDTDYIVRRVNACYAALLGGKVSSILGRNWIPRHGPLSLSKTANQNSAICAPCRYSVIIINLWSIVSPYVTIRGTSSVWCLISCLRIRMSSRNCMTRLICFRRKRKYTIKVIIHLVHGIMSTAL